MSADDQIRLIHAPSMVPPSGYSDGAYVPPGCSLVILGGHVAFNENRELQNPDELLPQIKLTLENLKATLASAGATPEDLVKLTIHTPRVDEWRAKGKEIGEIWRSVLGRTYPAMTLLGVAGLFDEGAVVEIDGLAALP